MGSTMRMTPEEYEKHMSGFPEHKKEKIEQEKSLPDGEKKEKKHKYNVRPKEERTYDGIVFDSVREMKFYVMLLQAKEQGGITFFLRQVPIRFKCGSTYWCDFLCFHPDRTYTFYEVKGMKTDVYKLKRRLLAEEYPEIIIMEV